MEHCQQSVLSGKLSENGLCQWPLEKLTTNSRLSFVMHIFLPLESKEIINGTLEKHK